MRRFLTAFPILLAASAAMADNLVANPGFEELDVDQPTRWELFVQPQPGAHGRLVAEAKAGEHAVMLHTPRPYESEPLNNWSQNVLRDGLGGTTFRAEASIKTAEATEAALWVQCWRRRPWSLLYTANSSFDAPVYGTQDWQTVDMEFTAPEGTDYLAVRCVLIGTGSAWFDEISVTEVEEPDDAKDDAEATLDAVVVAPVVVEEKAAETDTLVVAVPRIEVHTEQPEATEPAPIPLAVSPTPQPVAAAQPVADALAEARSDSEALADSVANLEAANRALLQELVSIREELLSLQGTPAPAPRTPPLVPHGADWQEDLR